ncbi:hypothetical protein GN244_ATG08224 [Phytophthora infestans]|uniref:Uncharacterized protein n=1 Tax=Phytophthora infestans TaxID=4787 RepID=A0A833TEI2_PHYIN|nr:hypothetical protein GN244_ATG08224 [Phytophthora infestans]KAF4127105.1 hypothetical protein GN958_ATG23702 [Phytophthora infestans]
MSTELLLHLSPPACPRAPGQSSLEFSTTVQGFGTPQLERAHSPPELALPPLELEQLLLGLEPLALQLLLPLPELSQFQPESELPPMQSQILTGSSCSSL